MDQNKSLITHVSWKNAQFLHCDHLGHSYAYKHFTFGHNYRCSQDDYIDVATFKYLLDTYKIFTICARSDCLVLLNITLPFSYSDIQSGHTAATTKRSTTRLIRFDPQHRDLKYGHLFQKHCMSESCECNDISPICFTTDLKSRRQIYFRNNRSMPKYENFQFMKSSVLCCVLVNVQRSI